MSRLKHKLIAALGLGLLWGLGVAGLNHIGIVHDLLDAFELKAYDYRMSHYRGPLVGAGIGLDDVVIVAIDERSLAELGQFARWPRYYHAALVDSLAQAGVRAVGFDILFPEPEGFSAPVIDFYAQLISGGDAERRNAVRRDLQAASSDSLFGDAVERAGCVFFGIMPEAERTLKPVDRIARRARGADTYACFPMSTVRCGRCAC